MKKTLSVLVASLALVAGVGLVGPAPAEARGGDAVIRTGNCSGRADWKLKGKTRDGRFEVEYEVDSNRAGQRWTFTIRQNGVVLARGARRTLPPSGSFSVERRAPNTAGPDTFTATARHARTGQTCSGTLTL